MNALAAEITELAKKMSFNQLRMNLNTLLRHGVLEDPKMVEHVAARLSDANAIARSRTMPFQLLAAYRHVDEKMPKTISPVKRTTANSARLPVGACPHRVPKTIPKTKV